MSHPNITSEMRHKLLAGLFLIFTKRK